MKGGIPVGCGIDWNKIKTEYITNSKSSYRKLAAKFGVPFTTVRNKGQEEKWREQKAQYSEKTVTDAINKISENQVKSASLISDISVEMLSAMKKDIAENTLTAARAALYKDVGAAIKAFRDAAGIEKNAKRSQAELENILADTELKRSKISKAGNGEDTIVNINFPVGFKLNTES